MTLNRKSFICDAMSATVPFLFSGCRAFGSVSGVATKKMKFGVQLYSLRDLEAVDMGKTFEGVRKLGLDGVELWNMDNAPACEVRRLVALNGLEICGSHIRVDMIRTENLRKTLDYAGEAGIQNLIVAHMQPGNGEKDIKGWWLRMADAYSRAAEIAKKQNCRVGYHNHHLEFENKIDGVTVWETFLSAVSKDVIVQLDVGSATTAGQDPVYWYKRFPGRSPSVHLREAHNNDLGYYGVVGDPAPGKPAIDWHALFDAINRDRVTEWGIFEPTTSNTFGTVRRSHNELRRMGLA